MRLLSRAIKRKKEGSMTEEKTQPEVSASPVRHNHWWAVAALVLLITTLASLAFLQDERRKGRELAATYDQMSVALSQTRSQLEAVTARLNAATAAPPPQPVMSPATPPEANAHHNKSHQVAKKRAPAEDPRWKQIQAELENHQKQIAATQEDMQKARADLEGSLKSTRDELGGSIARNHEELVALQKRGERDYVEFDLEKSKQFHRAGPLGISLRKADRKRQYCDVKLLVDDIEITKKHVNLFEPVMFYPADYKSPVELVINQIDKDGARGYVSTPKYRQSELATGAPAPTADAASASSTASLEHRPPSAPQ